jgi:nucleoside-diphosphate-sugar epimerase
VRILVLGGTQFVGRALVEAALSAGHELTLFHRGRTNAGLFPEVEHVLGDRDGGLAALSTGQWEVCVDVSGYLPRLVGDSAAALRDRVARYVYVSTISVYADLSVPRDENGPLATLEDEGTEEIDGGTYGALKALCEERVTAVFGERACIVRPGFVIGPYDHTGRFPWWAHRAARGGEMIVPASFARAFQAIDTRDLADFLLLAATAPLGGVFNATGPVPPVTMTGLVEEAARESGADLRVETVDDVFLAEQGVESALPLWPGVDPLWAAWAQADVSLAVAAGLRFRAVADTVAATLASTQVVPGIGLEPEREAAVLAAWHSR